MISSISTPSSSSARTFILPGRRRRLSGRHQARYERWLVHELPHAYQYQHGRSVLSMLPTAFAGLLVKSLYDYDGAEVLRGKTFADFNTEQQANIVADYNYLSTYEPSRDLSAYEPHIAFVRSGG